MLKVYTKHAEERLQQRGIKKGNIENIIRFFDIKKYRGKGKIALSISRKEILNLVENKKITPQDCDKISNTFVIMDKELKTIVTVIKDKKLRLNKRKYRNSYHHAA